MPHDHSHSSHDHEHDHGATQAALADPRYRRILWCALVLNLSMGIVEIAGGVRVDSVSLLADAADFFGDAASFAISLAVLSAAAVTRARTAAFKGIVMMTWGVLIIAKVLWNVVHGSAPQPHSMGAIGIAAMLVNLYVAWLLFSYRTGDANMRSVWLCTRNDALGNLAIVAAAVLVWFTGGRNWPDLLVALLMGGLALWSGWQVVRLARRELLAEPHHSHH